MDLLQRNSEAVEKWQPRPFFSESASAPPRTVIVSCADPRIAPEEFCGLQLGEAIVFRVIGGRIKPVLREILTLDSFLGEGTLRNLFIIHHTDCGASHFTADQIRREICERHPARQEEVMAWYISSFEEESVEESVRQDLKIAREETLIGEPLKDGLKGFVLDIKTGRLAQIEP